MTSYNGARWIAAQIDSILGQRDVEVDLVVSDDGSSDGTRPILERLQVQGKLRLTRRDPPTGSASQNFFAVIDRCTTDDYACFAFSDQDDVWDPDKLSRACAALSKEGAAGYSSAVMAVWPDGLRKSLAQSSHATDADFLFEGAGQGCTFVMTRDLFLRCREFLATNRERTKGLAYHDWTIYALARCWQLPWTFDPRPSMLYRQHDSNDTGAKSSWRSVVRRLSLIRSGWYAKQLAGIAAICAVAAPQERRIREWIELLHSPDGASKRWRAAMFCLRHGRRAPRDNIVLVVAALAGWLQVSGTRTGPVQ